MKKRNIFWAVILIFIAVYLVASKMHMIPAIPFFKILFTVIFVYTAVYGFVRLHPHCKTALPALKPCRR
mgnify:CR=1 FL=1